MSSVFFFFNCCFELFLYKVNIYFTRIPPFEFYLFILPETYAFVFSFCLISQFVSINKLDETVTYPSLENTSLGGSVPMQFACVQVALVRWLDLKRAEDSSTPMIYRQPLHDVKKEGLSQGLWLEPSLSQGLSQARQHLLTYPG